MISIGDMQAIDCGAVKKTARKSDVLFFEIGQSIFHLRKKERAKSQSKSNIKTIDSLA